MDTQSDDGKGSNASSPENEVEDTVMEDDVEADDASDNEAKSDGEGEGDNEGDGDGEGEGEGEGDNDDDDDKDGDDKDSQASDNDDDEGDDGDEGATQKTVKGKSKGSGGADGSGAGAGATGGATGGSAAAAASTLAREPSADVDVRWRPRIRPGAETASTYDIVPYVAAPQSTSIHAFCSTPCMKWIFTGGQDGYIRKYDWYASINGKVPLTVAQKHPFVDSVTRAGVLLSYWENEEVPDKNSLFVESDNLKISPVYSLATQSQALWLLSGLESGNINLQSVRHDEGKLITVLRRHREAVSVLNLGADEKSLLSGGWDKDIFDWDLNRGEVVREYKGNTGQVSAMQWRPQSVIPIPVERQPVMNGITASSLSKLANGLTNGSKSPKPGSQGGTDAPGSPASSGGFDSLFGGDDDDMNSKLDEDDLFGQELVNGRTAQNSTLNLNDGDDDVLMGDSTAPTTAAAEQQLINENNASASNQASTTETSGTASTATVAATSATEMETQATQETVGDVGLDVPDAGDFPRSPGAQSNTDANSTTTASGGDVSSNIFLAASIDGMVRVYDRRQETPITKLSPGKGTPPWSTSACWGVDGNHIYVGRRNGTVEEYNIHKDFQSPCRTLKFPQGSGAVSYVAPMINGRHLVCASFDNLRLYDLKEDDSKHSKVPFLIVPGHHGGVLSSVYVDQTSNYLLTLAGNRGWEGTTTEVLLGYEILPIQ